MRNVVLLSLVCAFVTVHAIVLHSEQPYKVRRWKLDEMYHVLQNKDVPWELFKTIKVGPRKAKFYWAIGDNDRCLEYDETMQVCRSFAPHQAEPLVHFPASYLDQLERVLIVGFGESFVLQEVLKYTSVQKVVQLDESRQVVDFAKRFLGTNTNRWNPKVDWMFGDYFMLLNGLVPSEPLESEQFDLIVVDAENFPRHKSYTIEEVTHMFRSLLRPNGVYVQSTGFQDFSQQPFEYQLHAEYNGIPHVFNLELSVGSIGQQLLVPTHKLMREQGIKTEFYVPLENPTMHHEMVKSFSHDPEFDGNAEDDLFYFCATPIARTWQQAFTIKKRYEFYCADVLRGVSKPVDPAHQSPATCQVGDDVCFADQYNVDDWEDGVVTATFKNFSSKEIFVFAEPTDRSKLVRSLGPLKPKHHIQFKNARVGDQFTFRDPKGKLIQKLTVKEKMGKSAVFMYT